MTDLELSEKLALAIGWNKSQLAYRYGKIYIAVPVSIGDGVFVPDWTAFDYRDWDVAGPIATHYNCFPKNASQQWQVEYITKMTDKDGVFRFNEIAFGQTPQEAIAKAVLRITLYPDN